MTLDIHKLQRSKNTLIQSLQMITELDGRTVFSETLGYDSPSNSLGGRSSTATHRPPPTLFQGSTPSTTLLRSVPGPPRAPRHISALSPPARRSPSVTGSRGRRTSCRTSASATPTSAPVSTALPYRGGLCRILWGRNTMASVRMRIVRGIRLV